MHNAQSIVLFVSRSGAASLHILSGRAAVLANQQTAGQDERGSGLIAGRAVFPDGVCRHKLAAGVEHLLLVAFAVAVRRRVMRN